MYWLSNGTAQCTHAHAFMVLSSFVGRMVEAGIFNTDWPSRLLVERKERKNSAFEERAWNVGIGLIAPHIGLVPRFFSL